MMPLASAISPRKVEVLHPSILHPKRHRANFAILQSGEMPIVSHHRCPRRVFSERSKPTRDGNGECWVQRRSAAQTNATLAIELDGIAKFPIAPSGPPNHLALVAGFRTIGGARARNFVEFPVGHQTGWDDGGHS